MFLCSYLEGFNCPTQFKVSCNHLSLVDTLEIRQFIFVCLFKYVYFLQKAPILVSPQQVQYSVSRLLKAGFKHNDNTSLGFFT